MIKDFRKVVTARKKVYLCNKDYANFAEISACCHELLGQLKILGPSIGWNSGPEGIYWPNGGQAASSFTVGDKATSSHRCYDQNGIGELTYIDPPSWMVHQAARLRTAPITGSISLETVYDSAEHSTEIIQIPCGQLPTRAVAHAGSYSFGGFLNIRWILRKRTAEEHM